MKSLKGIPNVDRKLRLDDLLKITSLEGIGEVNTHFEICDLKSLKTLKGMVTKELRGRFSILFAPSLKSLEGVPETVHGTLRIFNYPELKKS